MKTIIRLFLIAALTNVVSFLGSASAQDRHSTVKFNEQTPAANFNDKHNSDDVLSFRSDLVVLDVSVFDKNRSFIPGLNKTNFLVFDENVEQQIEVFSSESVPISFGFLVDTSGSMKYKLKTVIEGAKQMLEMCRAGDEIFVVDMKDTLRIKYTQPFTTKVEEARAALDNMYPSGGTALLDGISSAGKYAQASASNRRRALIVMSDGDDRDSMIKLKDLVGELRELDLQLYLIGFPQGYILPSGEFLEVYEEKAKNLMKKLADETGGEAFFPRSLDEISKITTKIGQELRSQYTIGYYAGAENRDGRWHKLKVKLSDKKSKYAVRTRSGYLAGK